MRKLVLFLMMAGIWLSACNSPELKESQQSQPTKPQNTKSLPFAEKKQEHAPYKVPKLESMALEEFLGKFKYRQRPESIFIGADFREKVDPQLNHFERVEVSLPDGKKNEVRMQNFGAWSISKNNAGNYEVLSTMLNANGVLMYFHTLDPELNTLGSFEIARRIESGGQLTVKKGHFSNDNTYHYTYYEYQNGQLVDSIQSGMLLMPSGKFKQLGESL